LADQIALQLRVLGNFEVLGGGNPVDLPPSRKTRALLAYLAVEKRPQRRERLCELFWEIPDDPRGALRWSLSRLRQVVGDALQADRNTVFLRKDGFALDYLNVADVREADFATVGIDRLEQAAGLIRGRFADDLALPRCPEYEAWRVAHANEVELLHLRLRRFLVDALTPDQPERALTHAHVLLALNPDDAGLAKEIELLTARSRQHVATPAAPAPALFASPLAIEDEEEAAAPPPLRDDWQDIRYCTTRDGVRIAYADSGTGAPIVKVANWMSHLQFDWESPIWRHWIEGLSAEGQLVRYDERGNGLSDWDVEDISFEAMVADLESVVDAAGLDRFALLGLSQGCALSVQYAIRHPERVSHMILYGGYVQGWRARGDADEIVRREAMSMLIQQGWGRDNPAFRQMFTSLFIPGASQEQMDWFNELQRKTVSPEMANRLHSIFGNIDVTDLLGQITAPTLVMHARDDAVAPIRSGRAFATGIPNARFVLLDSKNHLLLSHEPAFETFLREVRRFLAADGHHT